MNNKNQRILAKFVDREIIMLASSLVDDLLEKELISYDDYENYYDKDDEPQEIFEHWFVTEYLYRKLKELGEPVIDSNYGYIWGRTTTGQSIALDSVIETIASDMEILDGQKYSWSE